MNLRKSAAAIASSFFEGKTIRPSSSKSSGSGSGNSAKLSNGSSRLERVLGSAKKTIKAGFMSSAKKTPSRVTPYEKADSYEQIWLKGIRVSV